MKKTHIASAALTAASALFFSANAATVAEGVNTVGSVSMQIAMCLKAAAKEINVRPSWYRILGAA